MSPFLIVIGFIIVIGTVFCVSYYLLKNKLSLPYKNDFGDNSQEETEEDFYVNVVCSEKKNHKQERYPFPLIAYSLILQGIPIPTLSVTTLLLYFNVYGAKSPFITILKNLFIFSVPLSVIIVIAMLIRDISLHNKKPSPNISKWKTAFFSILLSCIAFGLMFLLLNAYQSISNSNSNDGISLFTLFLSIYLMGSMSFSGSILKGFEGQQTSNEKKLSQVHQTVSPYSLKEYWLVIAVAICISIVMSGLVNVYGYKSVTGTISVIIMAISIAGCIIVNIAMMFKESSKIMQSEKYVNQLNEYTARKSEEFGCFAQALFWGMLAVICGIVRGIWEHGSAFFSSIDADTVFYFILFLYVVAWIWGLVDCLKHEKEQQIVWVLLFIFVPVLGAILYFSMRFGRNRESQ